MNRFLNLLLLLALVCGGCQQTYTPVWDPPAPIVDPAPVDPVIEPSDPADPFAAPELAPARALRDRVDAGEQFVSAQVQEILGRAPRSSYTEIEAPRRFVERYYFASTTQAGVELGAYVYYNRAGGNVVDVDTE